MRVFTVVGNRPQFIKMSPVSRELKNQNIEEFILHTGQHFDANMSGIFFDELQIPKPNHLLSIHSKTHGQMTGEMLIEIERFLIEIKPNVVLLYGDTNSTLAGALAAAKLNIPIAHVEAGPRLFNLSNPEEINRVCTDKLSTWLFSPDKTSIENLRSEGITKNVFNVGDVMHDVFDFCRTQIKEVDLQKWHIETEKFVFVTLHRAENTASIYFFEQLFELFKTVTEKLVWPIHPRTMNALKQFGWLEKFKKLENLIVIEPVGYFDSVLFITHCKFIITDSGGVPKEGYYAGKKSIVLFNTSPWPELVKHNWNLVGINENGTFKKNLVSELMHMKGEKDTHLFGLPHAACLIVDILKKEIKG